MSRYLERVQEILRNADSKKVASKKMCVQELLELYENEDAILEICKNTKERKEMKEKTQSIVDWSYITHSVHRIVLNEADRLANKDSSNKAAITERNYTCILVKNTFRHANCYKVPLLKCEDIMPLILQILRTHIYEYYHDTYINVLNSYILPFRIYQVNMTHEQWKELLKICLNLYKYMSSPTSKRVVLDTLQMIIEYGCLHTNLFLNVKEILLFLESIFLDVEKNGEILAESIYKVTNTICQQIAVEYRITLCHFSENILPNIIRLDSSIEKYKLLLFFVKIHHPKGVCKTCDGAYAYDWEKWYSSLKSMYLMILKDFKADILSKSFLWFAIEVFKQVMENPDLITEKTSFNNYDYIQPAKRRRIAVKINGPVDMLIDNNPEEAWPMIQILTTLLNQYPECLKSEDFPIFLKVLVDLFTLSLKKEKIINNLFELAAVLLMNEKLCSIMDIEKSNIYWDQIWDILLRSLNINQNEISTHKLTQLFIIHNKITNPNALLKLYLTNVIKWSIMSLRTLIVICEHLPLHTNMRVFNINVLSPAIDTNSVRSCLIKWILNIPWHEMATQIRIDELCLLLIGITLKSKHQKQIKFNEYDINDICDCLKIEQNTKSFYEDIEHYYLLLRYKKNVFTKEKVENAEQKPEVNRYVLFMEDIVTYLINSLHVMIEDGNNALHIIIIKIAVVAKVLSMMKELNMVSKNIEDLSLIQALKNYIDIAYSSLEKITNPSRSKYNYLFNVTKALNILYGTSYDTDIAKIIVTSATLKMLENIFSLMNIEDNEISDYKTNRDYYDGYKSGLNGHKYLGREVIQTKPCNFCDKGTIRIQTTKALALFCCMNLKQRKCEIQIKLMNNLLKIDMYDLSHTVDFMMAITVLKSLSKYDKEELWKNHNELPLKNLLQLYHECYKDETITRYILNVLPYFFNYALVYNYKLDNLMNIIARFNKLRSEKRYGVLAHKEFIKCLSEIIYISPSHFCYTTCHTLNQMPIFEGILSSLISHSFLAQVQIIECIQKIYSLKDINFEWKEILFTKIEKSINKLAINSKTDDKIDDKIKTDEKEITTANISLMLAAIISTNGTFQCRALLTMLQFSIDKKVESQIISKSISIMANQINYSNIMEENLSYLMTYWFNSKYSTQLFPWNLTQCKSEEQFYKIYSNTIAFIKFQNLELSSVISFCNYINLSFKQLIENIFPQIVSWLLYCINENNGNRSKTLVGKIFYKLKSNQDEFAEMRKFSNLFKEKFEEILIFLIERLHDEDYLEEILGERISFAISDPPHFKNKTMLICLKYIEENFIIPKMSIQYFLVYNCPRVLQKILSHLINNVYKKKFEEHKIKAFHQYIFFCSFIIKELKEEYFNTLSMYIIKDIGYSLLHIIKLFDDTLCKLGCKYFYKFIKHVLCVRVEEIKEILNFTVITLIPIAQAGKIPIALEILQFLIIDQKEILSDAIEKLNSFPNVPIFLKIRKIHNDLKYKAKEIYSLEQEVKHFLCTVTDKDIHYSIEDIIHLRIQLSTRKEELRELYDKLETFHGFFEDCTSSILHRLIYKLIKLTASSDINVSIEAVKCLGELGPTDLTSMIYFEKSHVKESSDLIEILSYKIMITMVQFLFQGDIEFRKISANILDVVLSSSWGQKLLNTEYMNTLKTVLNESQAVLPLNYIQPFIKDKNSKMSNIAINYTKIDDIIKSDNTFWTTQSDGSYASWITVLTCNVLECFTGFYSENLIPICALSTDFCEIILPRIIFLIIHIDKRFMSTISLCINTFFEYHFDFTIKRSIPSHKFTNCDHCIVRCMLNIVNYIRMQVPNNDLEFNYICIAKAAKYCSAFFTAILYAEMSCETILDDYNNFTNISKIDYVYEKSAEQGKVIQNILRDSYAKIGDFDAINGTGSSHLHDHSTRIQHYIHTNKWDKVMPAQDVELSSGNMSVIKEMANGLYQSGLHYLLSNFISTMSNNGVKIDKDIQYECAWRLSNWDICETNQALYPQNNCNLKLEITEHNYHFYHYEALKYFHEGNETAIQNAIQNARINIIKALKNINLESSKTIYEKLMQLQLINEIEELSFAKQGEYEKILHKWQQQDIANFNEFQYIEPILTQRTVMFQINDTLINNANIKNALFNTYLQISKIAADKDNLHIATRSLDILIKQKDIPSKIQDQLLYQESLLALVRKDLDVGRYLLRNLMQKETLDAKLRAQILRVYGDWMAETKSENPQTVIEKYYLKSIDINTSINTQNTDTVKDLHDTQVALARFADNQYQQISSYMKSPQFENLKECITYSYKGINKHSISEDKDIRSVMILNQRQNTNDVAELEHIQKEKDNYLILALKYYLIALQHSENYNLLIFRIIALWLDNIHQKEVNDLLQENLNRLPSFKFIPLVPQLAAHMNDEFNEFSEKIYNIMQRCALEHPHHTLPVLLALKNLYGDYDYNTARKSRTLEPRVLGTQKLLQEIKESDINLIIQEMEKLSHALVMLANLSTSSNKSGYEIKIPRNQKILKIKNFENIFVLTLTIDVRPSRNYNNVIGIVKYTESYETVGGINTPKKLTCIGTDGIYRHELIKGRDDLRQDAVMQQVFNVMNILLKSHKDTKRRKLTIRTYKVVPLTQRSGILEWCDKTIPIITILVGSSTIQGLHEKYYPKDYKANYCRDKLAAVGKSSTNVKLKVFMDCCAHMHPVMHHFFIERYPSPETWFERRLAYTRSIATTSMAGYILGLGDRHLSNILIDQITAEVIHIDFGIAFEQGKVLPVPETIPFRLTRNIVDGMGVSGVEGTMRHCCEKTLTVLRDQRQIIITLLQVLLYDPLFKWTITPAEARNIQSGTSSKLVENNQCSKATNKTAERALLRIEQKLQGTEEGLASSVSGQVERLIQEAHDPMNLCRLYCGWQPYL